MLTAAEAEKFVPQMHEFNRKQSGGICWTGVLRKTEEGVESVDLLQMRDRPCYGEMRVYGRDSTRPHDDKPSDLTKPLRKNSGVREAIGLNFSYVPYVQGEDKKSLPELLQFMFSPESPWRRGLPAPEHIELTTDKGSDIPIGVVLTDTKYDPTVAVSLFIAIRSISNYAGVYHRIRKQFPFLSLSEALFLSMYCPLSSAGIQGRFVYSYTMPPKIDLRKWKHGTVKDLSEGKTMRDGYDYNRPDMAELFQPSHEDMQSEFTLTTQRLVDMAGGTRNSYGVIDGKYYGNIVEKFRTIFAAA